LKKRVDAIVSPDDNYLSHSGGASEALWRAAGPLAIRRPTLSLGDVFVTGAGKLPARLLLHAITIDFDANRFITPPQLTRLYQTVFQIAEAQSCRTVAIPLLASGAAGIPAHTSATALSEALLALRTGTTLSEVVLAVMASEYDGTLTARWLATSRGAAFRRAGSGPADRSGDHC
jgi:O-acetyl-ADP-ribose deacetylase (regulator of RNase III)